MRACLALFSIFLLNVSFANQAVDEIKEIYKLREKSRAEQSANGSDLKSLQKNFQMIFIFRSNCPHCHSFAPVLKDFSEHFNIKIKAYSADGGKIASFQSSPLTPELYKTFFITAGYKPMVPALYLMNKETMQTYPVLFGEATPYQLASRTWELMKHIKEQFNDSF